MIGIIYMLNRHATVQRIDLKVGLSLFGRGVFLQIYDQYWDISFQSLKKTFKIHICYYMCETAGLCHLHIMHTFLDESATLV